jgi:hypothetical protein
MNYELRTNDRTIIPYSSSPGNHFLPKCPPPSRPPTGFRIETGFAGLFLSYEQFEFTLLSSHFFEFVIYLWVILVSVELKRLILVELAVHEAPRAAVFDRSLQRPRAVAADLIIFIADNRLISSMP